MVVFQRWRAAWRLMPSRVAVSVQEYPNSRRPITAVSLWLNAGVPATQVAEWAGHSVHVLLKVYAKCIDGQDEAARKRIEAALSVADDQPHATMAG